MAWKLIDEYTRQPGSTHTIDRRKLSGEDDPGRETRGSGFPETGVPVAGTNMVWNRGRQPRAKCV